jgi:hypothetical protein
MVSVASGAAITGGKGVSEATSLLVFHAYEKWYLNDCQNFLAMVSVAVVQQ